MRWALLVLVIGGCFSPHPQPGSPCATGACPQGLICSPATATCELHAVDAAVVDQASHDARGDAPAVLIDAAILVDAKLDAPVDAPNASLELVQQATNHAASTATLSATFASAPTNGQVLVMIGANVSGSLASVSGGGATWTHATSSLINRNIEVWFGVTNGSSSTVTIERPNSTGASTMWIGAWSGLATAGTLDAATSTDGTTSPASAGTITTTNARDLLVFAVADLSPATFGTPMPGTWLTTTPVVSLHTTQSAWFRVESATGSFAPTVSTTGGEWDAAVVALKLAP